MPREQGALHRVIRPANFIRDKYDYQVLSLGNIRPVSLVLKDHPSASDSESLATKLKHFLQRFKMEHEFKAKYGKCYNTIAK